MSDEKDSKKDGRSLGGGPMERRDFLKKIGIAGGAALAHFFVLGRPSTAFGGFDRQPVEVLPIEIRSRCKPGKERDRSDRCYVKDGFREVGDHCFIVQKGKTPPREVGDQCSIINGFELGDQCTVAVDKEGNEVEVGDQCGQAIEEFERGDQCFISLQKDGEVPGNLGSGDSCRIITPSGEEIGDRCLVCNGLEIGDLCEPSGDNKTDQCFIFSTQEEVGDICEPPGEPTADIQIDHPQ